MVFAPFKPRTLVSVVLFSYVLYWGHRFLQLQHYRHCRADLFRVVLFSQSTLCTHMGAVLQLVEFVYHQTIRLIASQALGVLGGGIGLGDMLGAQGMAMPGGNTPAAAADHNNVPNPMGFLATLLRGGGGGGLASSLSSDGSNGNMVAPWFKVCLEQIGRAWAV